MRIKVGDTKNFNFITDLVADIKYSYENESENTFIYLSDDVIPCQISWQILTEIDSDGFKGIDAIKITGPIKILLNFIKYVGDVSENINKRELLIPIDMIKIDYRTNSSFSCYITELVVGLTGTVEDLQIEYAQATFN